MFSLYEGIDKNDGMAAEKLIEYLKNVKASEISQIPLLTILLSTWIKIKEKIPNFKFEKKITLNSSYDPNLCFAYQHENNFSLACTLSGFNTGLGSIHKNEVRIINYGPQKIPLGEIKGFGIRRTSSGDEKTPFRDVSYQKKSDGFYLHGWNRMYNGNGWLETKADYSNESFNLRVRLEKNELKHETLFVFFVKCREISVFGENPFFPSSLSRYSGPSKPVHLKGDQEVIKIEPMQTDAMQVIPLAGEDHFWTADFLISFSLSGSKKSYAWKID